MYSKNRMSFVANFMISSPVFRQIESKVPDMIFTTEDFYKYDQSTYRYVFWASRGDFQTMERAAERNDTVERFTTLASNSDEQLYRVDLSTEAGDTLSYWTALENDILFIDRWSSDGITRIRARVPSREALGTYRDACTENKADFQLISIYEEQPESRTEDEPLGFGLTPEQYKTVQLAFNRGYYDQNRQVTLETLAEELEISRQAVAGRLRRGLHRLISNTIQEQNDSHLTESQHLTGPESTNLP
jgi:predicted DNA binding protein